jgi:hypothetical protein
MNLYTAAAKSYAKAVRDLENRKQPAVEPQKTGGLLGRNMARKPKTQEAKEKQPYDMVLEAMEQIREYRNKI